MNQVAEKKNSALATFDMEADAQQGTQNISQEDLALPFLKILFPSHDPDGKQKNWYLCLATQCIVFCNDKVQH